METTRRHLPRDQIAAALRALHDEKHGALRALTARRQSALRARREKRAAEGFSARLAEENARGPPPDARPG